MKQKAKRETAGKKLGRSPKSPTAPLTSRWLTPVICLGLVAITWIVFGQTLSYPFVNYDDHLYVFENAAVKNGLTIPNLGAAFTHTLVGNWHPLTSISLMLDAQLFGLRAGGYHFDNVLLHTIAVLLLFLVLREMTGAVWRSAFVAALFAIHPLRAESVVWISERKDVLSGIFFMLALGTYTRYARRPPSLRRYLLLVLTFVLGLLSKAMLVTLPFVLLLLDYWPLQRFARPASKLEGGTGPARPATFSWLILEKVPLLVFAVAVSVATFVAQEPALEASEGWPLGWRISNALVSVWAYLREMVWPTHLAVFYPHPKGSLPLWEVGLALLLLLAITTAVIAWHRKNPYLVTGWFWYIGMLLPVIGIIQAGWQSHADRYTYLPQIGIYLLITWGAADLTRSWRFRGLALGSAAALVIAALMGAAWVQTGYWSDSVRLWSHALDVTPNNDVAQRGLGTALLKRGQVDQAIAHEQEALRLRPHDFNILTNLGNALLQKGEIAQAVAHYREALRLRPNESMSHRNLGRALLQNGSTDEALAQYRDALRMLPHDSDLYHSVGKVLLQKGQIDEAIAHFQKSLEWNPANAVTHYDLASVLLQKGRLDEAIAQFREAIRLQPRNAEAHNNVAIALLKKGQTREAISEWQQTLQLQPGNADAHNNLAVALLEEGQIAEAVAQWHETLRLGPGKAGTQLSLAWILSTIPDATIRNGNQALDLVRRAYQTSGDRNLMVFRVLAAAYAESGEFGEAIKIAQEGRQRAEAKGQSAVARLLGGDLTLYEQGVPLREASASVAHSTP